MHKSKRHPVTSGVRCSRSQVLFVLLLCPAALVFVYFLHHTHLSSAALPFDSARLFKEGKSILDGNTHTSTNTNSKVSEPFTDKHKERPTASDNNNNKENKKKDVKKKSKADDDTPLLDSSPSRKKQQKTQDAVKKTETEREGEGEPVAYADIEEEEETEGEKGKGKGKEGERVTDTDTVTEEQTKTGVNVINSKA